MLIIVCLLLLECMLHQSKSFLSILFLAVSPELITKASTQKTFSKYLLKFLEKTLESPLDIKS